MSTLRDPNSLGAFLIVPITILYYKVRTTKNDKLKQLVLGLLGLHLLALVLTFSRGAWVGCGVSVAYISIFGINKFVIKFNKRALVFGAAALLLLSTGGFLVRNQTFVQNMKS